MANDDMDLVRQYAASQSENAFAALVSRHANLVYSAALRRTGNPQLAEEITQAVFIILARKAGSLNENTIISGWLYRTACYVSGHAFKQEVRRQQREQEAYMQSLSNQTESELWPQIMPLLEEAMLRLGQTDRDALVLHFFEGRNLKEVGAILGASEAATKMRVSRAVEKLRTYFFKHGVTSSTAMVAGALSANSVQAAPAALAPAVMAMAIAKGATASTSTLTLIKGALKVMAWTKTKTAIVAAAGVLLVVATTVTVKEVHEYKKDSQWDTGVADQMILFNGPRIVRIIPTRFPNHRSTTGMNNLPFDGRWTSIGNGRTLGLNLSADEFIGDGGGGSPARRLLLTTLSQKKYDFIANVDWDTFREAVKKQFGVVGRYETIETNVLFLEVMNPNARGLIPSPPQIGRGEIERPGELRLVNTAPQSLALSLEDYFKIPVVDQTGLTGEFDLHLKWNSKDDPQQENLKQAMLDQLGLELVPGTAPVEMLVIERANN